jgi:hypothetical protein
MIYVDVFSFLRLLKFRLLNKPRTGDAEKVGKKVVSSIWYLDFSGKV